MNGIAFEGQFLEFLDGSIRQQKKMADRAMVQFIVLRLMIVLASASLPALTTIENRAWSIRDLRGRLGNWLSWWKPIFGGYPVDGEAVPRRPLCRRATAPPARYPAPETRSR